MIAGSNYNPEEVSWKGPRSPEMFNRKCSIGRIALNMMRAKLPNTVCQICESEQTTLTFGVAILYGIRIAQYFEEIGLNDTHTVGLVGPNTTMQLPVVLGCWFNCTPFHAVNEELDESVVRELFSITKPKVVFCNGLYYGKVERATSDLSVKIYTLCNHLEHIPRVEVLLEPTEAENYFQPVELRVGPLQVMAICTSAGNDGTHKCVTVSNASLIVNLGLTNGSSVTFSYGTPDCYLGILHLTQTVLIGGVRITTTRPFSPDDMLDTINRYNVTFVAVAPAHMSLVSLLPGYNQDAMQTVHLVYMLGDFCTPIARERILTGICNNSHLIYAYSSSEYGSITSTVNTHNIGSCGKLLPNIEMRIVDNITDEVFMHHRTGEIQLRCKHRFTGVYNVPLALSRALDPEGWYHTGDFGFVNDENELIMLHRGTEVFTYDNVRFSPYDIETIIAALPEVIEVCVFAVPDRAGRLGDLAGAAVVKKDNVRISKHFILDYVEEKNPEPSLHLNYDVFFVDEIKKDSNGRVLRREMKEFCLNPPLNGI